MNVQYVSDRDMIRIVWISSVHDDYTNYCTSTTNYLPYRNHGLFVVKCIVCMLSLRHL
jgi:hypothetical protein